MLFTKYDEMNKSMHGHVSESHGKYIMAISLQCTTIAFEMETRHLSDPRALSD